MEQAQPSVYLTKRMLQKMIGSELRRVGPSLQNPNSRPVLKKQHEVQTRMASHALNHGATEPYVGHVSIYQPTPNLSCKSCQARDKS